MNPWDDESANDLPDFDLPNDTKAKALHDMQSTELDDSGDSGLNSDMPETLDRDKIGPKFGTAIEWQDQNGNKRHWKGRGRRSKTVKDFLEGQDISGVRVVKFDYDSGTSKPADIPEPPKRDERGNPLPGTKEFDTQWEESKKLARGIANMLSKGVYDNMYGNPYDDNDLALAEIMVTPCMFKYYGYIVKDYPEVTALAYAGMMHFKHNTCLIDGQPVSRKEFNEHKRIERAQGKQMNMPFADMAGMSGGSKKGIDINKVVDVESEEK